MRICTGHRARAAGLALTTALTLAACSGGDEGGSSPSSSTSSSSTSPSSSPSSSSSAETPKGEPVAWPKGKPVPHLFVHSLIVDPKLAFDGDDTAQGYDDYMVTTDEFEKTLEQLHERDYVLVDPHDIAAVGSDGKMRYQELKLPKGKKPLVLSVDDVNYYEYMQEDGFADRLVLDDGRVRTEYTDTSGKTETGAHDVVPILDDFVDKNPDFSHGGAKGILALTGYEGSLGYDTSRRAGASGAKLTKEQAKAKKVADALKKGGWTFASHTWGHITMTDASLERVKKDQSSWAAEVEPITGPTDLLAYPFGADISTTEPYAGPVYDYLAGEGYDYFFNVDGSGPWQQLEGGYLRQGRINLDGILLRQHLAGKASSLKPYIDVDDTVDDARKR